MKLTILLFLIGIFAASGKTYSQQGRFNLNYRNVTIKEVFNEIKLQSDLHFFYSNDDLDISRKVDIQVADASVEDILNQVFDSSDIHYKIVDNVVIISRSDVQWSFDQTEQRLTVKGTVTDSSGLPLPGLTVLLKGSTQGTITDSEGSFTLADVPTNGILIFSFVGMETMEVTVEGRSVIQVEMSEKAIGLEEVVAVGYGTLRKSDITGSVSSVKGEDLAQMPMQRVDQALQGRASGVLVLNTAGAPGAETTIRVRGMNSINGGNNALVVIDGLQGGNLNALNPNDIESLEILKDASATAIYGARGANGVILITTKAEKRESP